MGEVKNEGLQLFLHSLQQAVDTKGANLLLAPLVGNAPVKGRVANGTECTFGYPVLAMDTRNMPGFPLALWFEKSYSSGKIKLACQFKVNSMTPDLDPLSIADVRVVLVTEEGGESNRTDLHIINYSIVHPQIISGEAYFTLEEYAFIKKKLSEFNTAYFQWNANIRWIDASDMEALEKIRAEGKQPEQKQEPVSGRIPLDTIDESAHEKVKGLLAWETEIVGAEKHMVCYKETMTSGTYHFLPQIYRIKADSITNAPRITIAMKCGNLDDPYSYRAIWGFDVGPYYHPNAERDLYNIINRRSEGKVKVCNFVYGGYDSAKFEWDREFQGGYLKELGVQALVKGDISTAPDTSFTISLESTVEGMEILKRKLLQESLFIGTIVFKVKEGIKEEIKRIPVKVELDLRKLTLNRLLVNVMDSQNRKVNFPYEAELVNSGEYTMEVGGCALSLLAHKKDQTRNAAHGLRCISPSWPVLLEKGSKVKIELHPDDVKNMARKTSFLGLKLRRYWTELVCQPYSVRLLDNDIRKIVSDFENLATNELEIWKLKISANISWDDYPDVSRLEVQIRNERYRTDALVSLSRTADSETVNMANNLAAISATQSYDNRKYEYRVRAILNQAVTDWSAWFDGSDSILSLLIFPKTISDLLTNRQ